MISALLAVIGGFAAEGDYRHNGGFYTSCTLSISTGVCKTMKRDPVHMQTLCTPALSLTHTTCHPKGIATVSEPESAFQAVLHFRCYLRPRSLMGNCVPCADRPRDRRAYLILRQWHPAGAVVLHIDNCIYLHVSSLLTVAGKAELEPDYNYI